ncbi:MAG: MBL fold metallo-hydrolase [Treponemataceae bacterium]|nr:MBL fold metallo-hydrolase [Spirochaetales bacterium]MDY6031910.1 MBL fold metallo-hydrolase [Treponemataceae bacterium]
MKLKFWGVRGSIPTFMSSESLMGRIQSVIERIKESDLKNQDSKQAFIMSLPEYLTSCVGGNTSCVQLAVNEDEIFVFDAGTGLRDLGKNISKSVKKIHIFLSHFHWDHIQGIPFFDSFFNKDVEIHFYSPELKMPEIIANQMKGPYFPVEFNTLSAKIVFHNISTDNAFCVSKVYVKARKMTHPNTVYSYLFILPNGKRLIFATDIELGLSDFEYTDDRKDFFENADIMIADCQYLPVEYHAKEGWGHSSYCYMVDFANHWHVKHLYMFHHEPMYDDKKLYEIRDNAREYSKKVLKSPLKIDLAVEHQEIDI